LNPKTVLVGFVFSRDAELVLLSRALRFSSNYVIEVSNIKRKACLRGLYCSLDKEIRRLLWNPKLHYCVRKIFFTFIPRATIPLKQGRSDLSKGYNTLFPQLGLTCQGKERLKGFKRPDGEQPQLNVPFSLHNIQCDCKLLSGFPRRIIFKPKSSE
jgi:hypothetical protein